MITGVLFCSQETEDRSTRAATNKRSSWSPLPRKLRSSTPGTTAQLLRRHRAKRSSTPGATAHLYIASTQSEEKRRSSTPGTAAYLLRRHRAKRSSTPGTAAHLLRRHREGVSGRKEKYLRFCQETSTPHFPVTELKLVNFVAFAVNQGLKHQTMKCHLSAIRHLQIECGGGDPRVESIPLLVLALRGTKQEQAGLEKRTWLPITPVILEQLQRVWNQDPSNPDHVMLWALCCVGFFGLLKSGEMTAP